MRTALFSIVSPNYRHYARVLMASVQRHHPDWDRYVLIVGEAARTEIAGEPFTVTHMEELRLPNPRQFCFRYNVLELNTAVKPWMFEHLFAQGYDRVVYLDPDTFVYSPLSEIGDAFLTLTPHLTGFIGGGDEHPSELSILRAGTYNLGFLTVSRHRSLDAFLGWWQEKLEHQCVIDVSRGLFVDQKWIDLTPGLFPDVEILRHDGYNVAYWNLRQRKVVVTDGQATVNGQPLRFFHFSGIVPGARDRVSRYDTLRADDVGDAAKLIEDYRNALLAAGHASSLKSPYAFRFFADGSRVPDAARAAYRESPRIQAACGADPFAHPELFHGLRDPRRSEVAAKIALRAYRVFSKARPLVTLLPGGVRRVMREFLLDRRDPTLRTSQRDTSLPRGLNVVGYVSRPTGVGESARLCQHASVAAFIPNELIDVDNQDAQQAVYRTSIHHVNADQMLDVHRHLTALFDASACNIGVWHWELPELPDEWITAAAPLDEIWAPSAFVQAAISRKVKIPVVPMPHGVEVVDIEPCSPEELGAPPGRFTFLCMFDLVSMDRKNPLGAADAFRRAFGDDSNVALLVKAGQSARFPGRYAELEERLRGIPNIALTNQTLPRPRVNGLIAACDAVVSLHHSEGFGLVPAEAMSLGKPVIATGWSGNMDFMNGVNSCPVGFTLTKLDRTYDTYPPGQQWAEPDLDHAAHCMRRVYDDAQFRASIAARALQTMRTEFSPRAAGLRYRARLEFLGLL